MSANHYPAAYDAYLRLVVTSNRAADLVRHGIAVGIPAEDIKGAMIAMDVIRASIVLLHVALEEFLRDLGRDLLVASPSYVLNDVPLIGQRSLAPSKFLLGELKAHTGKSVDDLICESIDDYLSHRTFNSSSEVNGFLEKCGVDSSPCKVFYAEMEVMMKKRHAIVHQGDNCPRERRNAESLASRPGTIAIEAWSDDNLKTLMRWPAILCQFGIAILRQYTPLEKESEVAMWEETAVANANTSREGIETLLAEYRSGKFAIRDFHELIGIASQERAVG